ncbi:MAG: hypothetical protein LAO31_06500 [Acidobacteriia bacterium]|nr:hypothetical protein [Terriglobia bacterium]
MEKIVTASAQISKLVEILRISDLPSEEDRPTHPTRDSQGALLLANSYFALVSICHQTSPLGERRLEGIVDNVKLAGWDYLEGKFRWKIREEPQWASPEFWRALRPLDLSGLYEDPVFGKTLNRVNERALLLNDLGQRLMERGHSNVGESFDECRGIIGGDSGFLAFLKTFEAYKDPVMKKAHLFLAIMVRELGWAIQDPENLRSPVDYHEMRGHLRMGTLLIQDQRLASKVQRGLTLTEEEDCEIRSKIQAVNTFISNQTGLRVSVVHSLFWNLFRSCCHRLSNEAHCSGCGDSCNLLDRYKKLAIYKGRCLFSEFCKSAEKPDKIMEPPYAGHYY